MGENGLKFPPVKKQEIEPCFETYFCLVLLFWRFFRYYQFQHMKYRTVNTCKININGNYFCSSDSYLIYLSPTAKYDKMPYAVTPLNFAAFSYAYMELLILSDHKFCGYEGHRKCKTFFS